MKNIFYPEHVVVIGASSEDRNLGRIILENLIEWKFKGRISAVHPGGGEFEGIKIHRTLENVPAPADMAVILVKAAMVPELIEQCAAKGIKTIALPAGGFTEYGRSGADMEKEILQKAGEQGIRIIGPNGLTVANASNGLCLPFFPISRVIPGNTAAAVQSGGIGLSMLTWMQDENLGVSKFISMGNKSDLDETDYIEYLLDDPETETICCYLESIKRGRRLMRLGCKADKPVIICKAHVHPLTAQTAMSHTAAIANDDDVVSAAFKQSGIIRVSTLNRLVAQAKSFRLPPLKGKKLLIISLSGGYSVIAADQCARYGYEFAELSAEFYRKVDRMHAGVIKLANPVDLGDVYSPEVIPEIARLGLAEKNVDAAVFIMLKQPRLDNQWKWENVYTNFNRMSFMPEIIRYIRQSGKPAYVVWYAPENLRQAAQKELNYPLFSNLEETFECMNNNRHFYRRHIASTTGEKIEAKTRIAVAADPDVMNKSNGKRILSEKDTFELLKNSGIPVTDYYIVKTLEEAQDALEKINKPAALKLISPGLIHKTEIGGISLDIKGPEELENKYIEMNEYLQKNHPQIKIEGFLLQPMAEQGIEMILGIKRDPAFGPVILTGLGGVYTEIFKDSALRIAPLSEKEAISMIKELQGFPLLKGYRKDITYDIHFLAFVIERLSQFAIKYPQIEQLDLNPFILHPKQGIAVDAACVVSDQ